MENITLSEYLNDYVSLFKGSAYLFGGQINDVEVGKGNFISIFNEFYDVAGKDPNTTNITQLKIKAGKEEAFKGAQIALVDQMIAAVAKGAGAGAKEQTLDDVQNGRLNKYWSLLAVASTTTPPGAAPAPPGPGPRPGPADSGSTSSTSSTTGKVDKVDAFIDKILKDPGLTPKDFDGIDGDFIEKFEEKVNLKEKAEEGIKNAYNAILSIIPGLNPEQEALCNALLALL